MAEYLPRNQAAEYLRDRFGLKIAAQTLAAYACHGTGPFYRLAGRNAVYTPASLNEWAETRLSRPIRSSSELRVSA